MEDKASTAVERVLRTNQRLREKHVEEADKVSKQAGDKAAGDAMRDALEEYDRLSGDYCRHKIGPDGPCAICDAPKPKRQDHDPSAHVSHVHFGWW